MINIKYFTEKAALNNQAKSGLFLVELEGVKKAVNKAIKRQKLNLSLVIDVSGSMQEYISYQPMAEINSTFQTQMAMRAMIGNPFPNFPESGINRQPSMSKMELVKKAAIKAVESLKEGDFVSLVIFHSSASVVKDATKVTAESKIDMIRAISQLSANGGTNLHSGWLSGATEVVKNLKDKYINRVMVLTDGETMSGIVDPKEIAKDVAAIYKSGVSTSTFGVGNRFNETLLQSMSDTGGGNFYYIKDEKEFDQMFSEEFTGMANVAATEITLQLQLAEGFKIAEQMNSYESTDGVYKLSNVLSGNKLSVLFKLDTDFGAKPASHVVLGELAIEYKDENGNKVNQVIQVEADVLSEKKWEKLDFVQEVKIQETLLMIAKNKAEASAAIAAGNLEGAKGLLRSASGMLGSCEYADARISASMASLNTTLSNADTMDSESLKKSMHYEAYKTRSGKDLG